MRWLIPTVSLLGLSGAMSFAQVCSGRKRAGHGAGKPRGMILDEQTDIWSFLFSQLGIQ